MFYNLSMYKLNKPLKHGLRSDKQIAQSTTMFINLDCGFGQSIVVYWPFAGIHYFKSI